MSDSYFLAFIMKAPFLVMIIFTAICRIEKNGRKRGCLFNKTHKQKVAFFKSLYRFMLDDNEFFREQYLDLQEHERAQYNYWLVTTYPVVDLVYLLILIPHAEK